MWPEVEVDIDAIKPSRRCGADIKSMLRIVAAIVANEGPAYLPLLQRLKREFDAHRPFDAKAYARELLDEVDG